LGNLLNRTVSMAHRYGRLEVLRGELSLQDLGLGSMKAAVEKAWDEIMPSVALQGVWVLLRRMNSHIDLTKPWLLAKQDVAQLDAVLGSCCEALRWAALMVAPAMPGAAREILRQLGRGKDEGSWPTDFHWPGGTLTDPKPVFPRIEPERQAALIARWMPGDATATAPVAAPKGAPPAAVTFDDFGKIE